MGFNSGFKGLKLKKNHTVHEDVTYIYVIGHYTGDRPYSV